MYAWFVNLAGSGLGPVLFWLVVVALLIGLFLALYWLFRRAASGTFIAGGRNRRPRLAVIDAAAVDSRRRLVLIRRDDTEHLIMIGGPSDLVIEQGIKKKHHDSNSISTLADESSERTPEAESAGQAPREPAPRHLEPVVPPVLPAAAAAAAVPSGMPASETGERAAASVSPGAPFPEAEAHAPAPVPPPETGEAPAPPAAEWLEAEPAPAPEPVAIEPVPLSEPAAVEPRKRFAPEFTGPERSVASPAPSEMAALPTVEPELPEPVRVEQDRHGESGDREPRFASAPRPSVLPIPVAPPEPEADIAPPNDAAEPLHRRDPEIDAPAQFTEPEEERLDFDSALLRELESTLEANTREKENAEGGAIDETLSRLIAEMGHNRR